ncbi:MAG: TlpA family protein disulfide reductase [Thermoanaerobaculia bacterium]|nr:TlpA family protein disulfide reductase [Thermoanaerobaculia bacterium]
MSRPSCTVVPRAQAGRGRGRPRLDYRLGSRSRGFRVTLWCVATLSLLGFAGCSSPERPVSIGQPLPPFELPRLGGGPLASDELAGEVPVLVNFWATWCHPCIKEIPALRDIHRSGSARVVSISLDTVSDTEVARFVRDHEIEYEVLRADLAMLSRYGSTSIPYTLVLDSELVVRSLHRVAVSSSTLRRDVDRAR